MNKLQVKETLPISIQDLCPGDCFQSSHSGATTEVFMKITPSCPYANESQSRYLGQYNCINLSNGKLCDVPGLVFPVIHVTIERK